MIALSNVSAISALLHDFTVLCTWRPLDVYELRQVFRSSSGIWSRECRSTLVRYSEAREAPISNAGQDCGEVKRVPVRLQYSNRVTTKRLCPRRNRGQADGNARQEHGYARQVRRICDADLSISWDLFPRTCLGQICPVSSVFLTVFDTGTSTYLTPKVNIRPSSLAKPNHL